jgi:hypothetical protein
MIRRRTALSLLAGAAVGATALPPAALAASQAKGRGKGKAAAFDPKDPQQLALAFRKLAYSADETLTFWWMKGTRYGVTGSLATAFWDMYVAAWFTTRDLPDGKYEVKMSGCNFYTPPGGTTLLEKFENPYTGKTVDVPYGRPRTSTTLMDLKGGSAFAGAAPPGMKSTRNTDIGPAWVEGEALHVQGDIMMHNEPLEPGKRSFTVQDWSTYIGTVADVLDPKMKNPPSAQMFNDILDFPPWLQMGDYKGTYVSRCYGRKVYDYPSMPALWRGFFEQKFPDVAKDPGAVLRA